MDNVNAPHGAKDALQVGGVAGSAPSGSGEVGLTIADAVTFCRERAQKHKDYIVSIKQRPGQREYDRWYCAMMEADHIANILEATARMRPAR